MERRKAQRYTLRLPLSVIKSSGKQVSYRGETRNISSAGVLFTSFEPVAAGPIEYSITLSRSPGQVVAVRCFGNVVRTEQAEEGNAFHIAATLQRFEFQRDVMGE